MSLQVWGQPFHHTRHLFPDVSNYSQSHPSLSCSLILAFIAGIYGVNLDYMCEEQSSNKKMA